MRRMIRQPGKIGLLFFLLAAAYALALQSHAPDSSKPVVQGMSVENMIINNTGRLLNFDIMNTSRKHITAYVLAITITYSSGHEHRFYFGADYAGVVDSNELFGQHNTSELRFIRSGGLVSRALPLPENNTLGTPLNATAWPEAVIYADNSAEGKSERLDELFDARAAKYRETVYWQDRLHEGQSTESPVDAINGLASLMSKSDAPALTYSSPSARSAARLARESIEHLVQQVRRYVAQDPSSAMKISDALQNILSAQVKELAKSLRQQPQ